MQNNLLISSRIKQLRISHKLGIAQLADIMGKTASAISQIESGKINISLEFIITIANFFAVSLDWLIGHSDEPYSIPVIEQQEKAIIDLEHSINLNQNTNLIYFKAVMYCCRTKSSYYPIKEKFSIDNRADALYALNFWKYAAKRLDEEGYNSQEKSYQEALRELMDINDEEKPTIFTMLKKHLIKTSIDAFASAKSGTRTGASFAKLCYECIDVLDGLLVKNPSAPPHFDVRKSPSE